jgi:hypothetical protein
LNKFQEETMSSNPHLHVNSGKNPISTFSDKSRSHTNPQCVDEIEKSSNTIVMGSYNAYSTVVSTTQPEIVTAIQQLQEQKIEIEIISKAIDIYYRLNSIKINDNQGNSVEVFRKNKSVKGSRKIRLIFYCIFMAYNELGIPVDPTYVADIVKLPRKETEQALAEYSPSGTTIIEPEKMIMFYIRRINMIVSQLGITYNEEIVNQDVKRIIEVCKTTPIGKEWIENTAAKHVAVAALYFYMNDIKGIDIISKNICIFESACYSSWACIRRYHGLIAGYYNSDVSDQKIVRPKISIPYTI